MLWEPDSTYYIVLFVKKNPASRTHTRSLFIGQEPGNVVIQPTKRTTAVLEKCSPLGSPIRDIVLDLNNTLLPNSKRDGLLLRNLLKEVQCAWPLEDPLQLIRGCFQDDRILGCGASYDGEHLLESGGL